MNAPNFEGDVKILEVDLGEKGYPIHIGPGLIRKVGVLLKGNLPSEHRCIVVTSNVIHPLHGGPLMEGLDKADIDTELVLVPNGEESKSWEVAGNLLGEFVDLGLDRQSIIVAFGGGAVGDLAGFVASIYLRGVRLVQVPTTLLAQVDSSIGGKTAINHPKGKNLIGTFHQPSIVIIDPSLLQTLPQEEFISGLAEVVKYGVIADAKLFNILEKIAGVPPREQGVMTKVITRCCAIKARFVEQDERDTEGVRAALNYGHTVGHVLEILTHLKMRHGEAIAVGMDVAARISNRLDLMGEDDVERQKRLLSRLGLATELPDLDSSKLLEAMQRDKKMERGTIRFVLPTGIGRPPVLRPVPERLISQALEGGDD